MRSVAIIGGGITGVTLAHWLVERGHEVRLIERSGLGAGTTGKSIGCFVSYLAVDDAYRPLVERTWNIYEPLVDDGFLDYHRNGFVKLATSNTYATQLTEEATAVDELEIPFEWLDPTDVDRFGVTEEAAIAGALYYPRIGRLDPGELVAQFADTARAGGADFILDTTVEEILLDGESIRGVKTSKGTIHADLVVNAAGPWAPMINDLVGVEVPLRHTLAPILTLETDTFLDLPTIMCEDGLYLTGERSKTVLAGHSPHESAVASVWEQATLEDPDRIDRVGRGAAGESFRIRVALEAEGIVPALADATVANEWCGLRCMTPDEFPVAGSTSVDGYLLATGMSGVGITVAPAVSEAVVSLIETGSLPRRCSQLTPERFAQR